MNNARLIRIANRINLLLLRELGQGIDVKRLLTQPLYARDVLLVCEAQPGSDLDSLARHFRLASIEPIDENGQPSTFGADSTGFGLSRPALDSEMNLPLPKPSLPARRWFGR